MKTFVINLAKENKRREFQKNQLQKLGLDYEIIMAESAADISDEIYQKHYFDWQRPLRKAEIACYFSHQKLWHKVIKNNTPALILEDDAILSKDTLTVLNALAKRRDLDLVDFEIFNKKKYVAKTSEPLLAGYKLCYLHLNSAGAAAYVLYPSGAKKLLNHEEKQGIAPTDSQIPSCHSLKSYQIEPALAMQPEFLNYYGLENNYESWTYSTTSKENMPKREFVFRLKRINNQIKLGLYKLTLLSKTNKRFITLNKQDFTKL